MDINSIERRLSNLETERNLHSRNIKSLNKLLDETHVDLTNHIKAREYMQRASQLTQTNLEKHLSDIVSRSLDIVFEEEAPKFKVKFVIKRNASECEMHFTDDGINEMDPQDSCGFGAVDVASFALRISIWALNPNRNCFIFDEPFRNLDEERMPRASLLLKILAEELNIQMIVVTHKTALEECADKIFVVAKTKDGSTVKEK